jgi:uncharacterized tellurite resistance protein B-like protein
MFSRLKEFFFEDKTTLEVDQEGEPTNEDLQIATAVLLLEMAGADDDYAPEEVKACFRVLEQQFNVSDEATLELFEKADSLRKEKGKIDEFVAAINENFDVKQRMLVLAMVWKVIIADQQIENHEKRFATQLRTRLQLTREQAEEAKQTVLQQRL